MKKKASAVLAVIMASGLSTLAFAAEGEGPFVKGNVELYGALKVSADYLMTDNKTDGADKDYLRVSSNSSRLGIRGKEAINEHLNVVAQVELGIAVDGGETGTTDSPKFRNTFVGLNCKVGGTLIAGTHDTPYKMSTAKLDVFSDSMGDYNAIVGTVNGTSDFDLRPKNSIMYTSPLTSGFQVMVAFSKDKYESSNGTAPDPSEISVAGTYDKGPLSLSLAYEQHKNGFSTFDGPATASIAVSGLKAGVGYALGDTTKVGVIFEAIDSDANDSANTRNAYYASVAHKIGKETLKAAVGFADDGKSDASTAATHVSIGIDHSLSPRTVVYAVYANTNNSAGATYGMGQSGAGGAYVPNAGENPSSISIGLNHSF